MEIVSVVFSVALFLSILGGIPYLIYTKSNNRSCQGCAVGGCGCPLTGFLLLFIAVALSSDAPDFGDFFFLLILIIIGSLLSAIVGAFLKELEE